MLEKNLQKNMVKHLTDNGWFVVKTVATASAGFPDLFLLKNGRTVHVEVKTPTGKLSARQRMVIDDLRGHGGEVIVARSIADLKILA